MFLETKSYVSCRTLPLLRLLYWKTINNCDLLWIKKTEIKIHHIQSQIFSLAKYEFSLRSFHIIPRIRNIIRLLEKKINHLRVKRKENSWNRLKIENSGAEWRNHIIFHATLILFTRLYNVFYYIYQYCFTRKYMLMVINYINFATCPTILTRSPTIFIGILKVCSNNYVC